MAESTRSLPLRFDPFSLVDVDDPYPLFAQLREAGPLCRGGAGVWLVPRHADVSSLLRDLRLGQFQFPTLGDGPALRLTRRAIAGTDRPRHTRLRQVLAEPFGPAALRRLAVGLDSVVDGLLAPALEARRLDAVRDLAFPLPMRLLGDALGIPEQDREPVGRRILELAALFSPVQSAESRAAADHAVEWLGAYLGALLDHRRRAPAGDVLTRLAAADIERDEAVDNAIFVLFAGLETSVTLLSSCLAILPRHPAQLAVLRRDPSLLAAGVEELLRYDAPTQFTGRIVQQAVEVGGRTLRPGRVVFLLIASANHDEREFTAPERLDVTRGPNRHLSFGAGVHSCLGAALARVETAAVLRRLLLRSAVIEPAGDPVLHRHASLRSYESVPVRLEPAP